MRVPKQKNKSLSYLLTAVLLTISNLLLSQTVADFSSSTMNGCTPILVNFTDQSSGNPTEWKWDLGNGTFSNLQHPSVTYFTPGMYTIKLWVRAGNSRDSLVRTNYINVYQAPSVSFISNAVTGCNPFKVNFSDMSTSNGGTINSWQWDFGDGIVSSQQHPLHIYSLVGNYNVTLKVINSNGCMATFRKPGYIRNNGITGKFTDSIFATCTPNKIIFKNTSVSNDIFSSHWEFDDGSVSAVGDPVHIYTAGGNYTVKLIVNSQAGCTDTIVKHLQVMMPVNAFFTGGNLVNCSPPVTENFTNQNLTGNSYYWDFGDSTTSTSSNPVHQFNDTGNYTVKLIVKNINGCTDSLKKYSYIKIHRPFLIFADLPDSGCLALTKYLSVASGPADNIINYSWDFGDGTTSSLATPAHTFNAPGYYNITAVGTDAYGCKDTAYMPYAIRITTQPVANFSASIRSGCASTKIPFTNLSTGNITSWLWDFGDRSTSTEQNPIHFYIDTGWMKVTLIVMNGGCADTAVFTNYIYIKPAIGNFAFTMNCAVPLVRTFQNLSKGVSRWQWDFGDGTTSAAFEPIHTFPGQGMFTVKLTVWNDSTGCMYVKTKNVRIIDVTPTLFASDTIVCKESSIRFISGLNNQGIARYYWDFGDSSTIFSTMLNRNSHEYKMPGNYSVVLITMDSLNCMDTLIKPMYIKVNGPRARFGVSVPVTCVNSPVVFSDSSLAGASGPLRMRIWDYANGRIDTLTSAQPFQRSFTNQGNYGVTLKVTDSSGCTDNFKLMPSLVVNKISALFGIPDPLACPNFPVRFICPYYTTGIYYRWDFGDGTSSNLQLPVHIYTSEGNYTVTLYVRDSYGCEDITTQTNAVRIVQTRALFNMSDSFRTCPPLLIQFTNQSVNAVDEYWDFGDSSSTNTLNPAHFYTNPGVYTATLYARGEGGCVKTMQRQIVVKGPKGKLTYDPLIQCRPYQVNFKIHSEEAVSYTWDFNDGTTLNNTDSVVTHLYQDSGNFVPKVILVDDIGCRAPVSGQDTIHNLFAKASFSFPRSVMCNRDSTLFTSAVVSNDPVATYRWDFGDGTASGEKHPVHFYTAPGLYYPSLYVTTRYGCTGGYRPADPVKVAFSPGINVQSGGNGCAPLTTTFSAVQTATDTSSLQWHWIFGNGVVSELENPPPQLYTAAGLYTVTLAAGNSNGCSTTIQQIIEAYSLPVVRASGDTVLCRGKATNLQVNGAARYKWVPAAGLSCDTCASTVAGPGLPVQYIVTGTSLHGCSNKDTVTVYVKQPFKMVYNKPGKLCAGQGMRLEANGATTYQWSPAYGLNSPTAAITLAKPDTTTSYRVIGTDDKGCFKDTGYVKLTVYPVPTVDAGADKTISGGMPVNLEAVYSNDVTEVNWSPTSDMFRNSRDIMTVKPTKNTEYTLEVKNPGGCAARDRVTVFVTCNNNNVFIPNLFSPNADGVNDVFFPRGTGLLKIRSMIIFNKWGEAVFEKRNFDSNDASKGWDGTWKGSKLSSDVYVYMIDLVCDNNSVLSLNGNVALVN